MFIERITIDPGREHGDGWPFTLPPVEYLADHGLAFNRPITFLVGENGSGKSTLVEAIADAVKINAQGGKAGTRYASTGNKTLLGEAITAAPICLTHSPFLAATAGAEIIEVGDHGLRHTAWDELDIATTSAATELE